MYFKSDVFVILDLCIRYFRLLHCKQEPLFKTLFFQTNPKVFLLEFFTHHIMATNTTQTTIVNTHKRSAKIAGLEEDHQINKKTKINTEPEDNDR